MVFVIYVFSYQFYGQLYFFFEYYFVWSNFCCVMYSIIIGKYNFINEFILVILMYRYIFRQYIFNSFVQFFYYFI